MVEENLKTMVGGKDADALDEKTGHIMIIAAEYGPAPPRPPHLRTRPRRAADAVRRGQMVPDSFTILEVGK